MIFCQSIFQAFFQYQCLHKILALSKSEGFRRRNQMEMFKQVRTRKMKTYDGHSKNDGKILLVPSKM